MNRYIYNRVSSLAQDYEQQRHCISEYFAKVGISPESITETVVEKVSGTIDYTERKLSELIEKCESGDVIYISELSRLGRNMSNLFAIVTECSRRGITIIQAKDGTTIENESIGGKALLFALGLAAEIEVANIRQRTKMGLAARKDEKNRNGHWISKAGNFCTHLGQQKGYKMEEARQAAYESRTEKKNEWRDNSPAWQWVKSQIVKGKGTGEILEEFLELAKHQPEVYCTRNGTPMTLPKLSQWKRQILEELRVEAMA